MSKLFVQFFIVFLFAGPFQVVSQEIIDMKMLSIGVDSTVILDKFYEHESNHVKLRNAGVCEFIDGRWCLDGLKDSKSFFEDKFKNHSCAEKMVYMGRAWKPKWKKSKLWLKQQMFPEFIAFRLNDKLKKGTQLNLALVYLQTDYYQSSQPNITDGGFTIGVYSCKKPRLWKAHKHGVLKEAKEGVWNIDSLLVLANKQTKKHDWIILYPEHGAGAFLPPFIRDFSCLDTVNLTDTIKPVKILNRVVLNDINFATGKSTLPLNYDLGIENVLNFLKLNDSLDILIEGHTDSRGDSLANITLSENRAKTISKVFETYGINKNRILVHGFGANVPIASNKTDEGRKLNRRVEITWD